MTNAKDNRNSQVFESLALLAPTQPAVSDKERKKFEDEKSKLYLQLDEKVSIDYNIFILLFSLASPKNYRNTQKKNYKITGCNQL